MAISITFLATSAFALEINEVELNPDGSDSGNEWLELYSEEEINLTGYYIENEDGGIFNLTETFSGYFVIEFESQWLDNSNVKIKLLDNKNNLIAETDILNDNRDDTRTWSLCDNDWIFINASKGEENNCKEESNSEDNENEEDVEEEEDTSNENEDDPDDDRQSSDDESEEDDEIIPTFTASVEKIKEERTGNEINLNEEKIILNVPKEDKLNKTEESVEKKQEENEKSIISNQEKLRLGVIYSFLFLTIVLIILLAWRKL